MVFAGGLLFFLELALVLYCVLDIVTTPADRVRNLPKLLWLVLVVLLPIVGGVGWFLAGRPTGAPAPALPRPPRRPGPTTAPDDDEDFLRGLRERAEQQRRQREQDEGGPAGPAGPSSPPG